MVANVWKVSVAEGQSVNEGDTLLVLESMKTEIPVTSPCTGVVRELLVTEGSTVAEGDIIAIVE